MSQRSRLTLVVVVAGLTCLIIPVMVLGVALVAGFISGLASSEPPKSVRMIYVDAPTARPSAVPPP